MARLLPSHSIGMISPETAKVLHALSRIPGDEYLVWTSMPVTAEARPELMLLHEERSCWLISISAATESRIESAMQGALFSKRDDPALKADDLGIAQRQLLDEFYTLVLAEAGVADPTAVAVHKAVAFPNVRQGLLDQVARLGGITGFAMWGREMIRSKVLAAEIGKAAAGRLPGGLVHCLRRRFSPESVIPAEFVPRASRPSRPSLAPALDGFLLDLDQEWLVKDDLLSAEAEAALGDLRLRLVTGVAGSGKSLVLLYRAMLQARLRPESRILVLTHNRPLHGELRDRFDRLAPDARVEWNTFYRWCRARKPFGDVIYARDRETLVANLAHADPRLARLPAPFLLDEIDWLKDNALNRRARYLGEARTGRGRPLTELQRIAFFDLFEKYEAELRARGRTDWTGVALALWESVAREGLELPQYDFVFIDEAQFFAPAWFGIVKRAVRAGTGQLFLAADPTQGFLKRRQSWLASGLDVRGRATRLQRPYRNTRAILKFAAGFYRGRMPDDDEEINLPDAEDLERLEAGPAPELIQVGSGLEENLRVRNEIATAIRAGAPPESFLVIHSDERMAKQLVDLFNEHAPADRPVARALGGDERPQGPQVRITNLNKATGIESAVVFLCGLDRIFEKEDRLGLDDTDRSELIRDNTRRIYMGMTRACQRLVLTYASESVAARLSGLAVRAAGAGEASKRLDLCVAER